MKEPPFARLGLRGLFDGAGKGDFRSLFALGLNFIILALGLPGLLLFAISFFTPPPEDPEKDQKTAGSYDYAPPQELYHSNPRAYLEEYFVKNRKRVEDKGQEYPRSEAEDAAAVEAILVDIEKAKTTSGKIKLALREFDCPVNSVAFTMNTAYSPPRHILPLLLLGLAAVIVFFVVAGYANFWKSKEESGAEDIGYKRKPRWGLFGVAQFFLAFCAVGLVAQIIGEIAMGVLGGDEIVSGRISSIVSLFGFIALSGTIALLVYSQYRNGPGELGIRRFGALKTAQIIIATCFVYAAFLFFYFPVTLISTYVVFASGFPLEPQNVMEMYMVEPSVFFKIVLVLLAVVAAPLCEEFLFRSFLFSGMRNSFRGWFGGRLGGASAVVLTAFIFAIFHPGPFVKIPIFFIGLMLAVIYYRTQSYVAAVTFHALHNGLQLALVTFLGCGIHAF